MDLSERLVWPLLGSLVLLGASLRVAHLDSSLWYDEIMTLIDSVRRPLTEIVTHFPGTNDHLLYSVLAHASVGLFGEHSWTLRLPAVLFGVAAIPMLYFLGTKVTNRLEAFLAALLLAVSYHHVWFSQNARGYTALLFGNLLATYLLLIALKSDRRSAYLGYAVTAALGAYTHLTMVFVVVSHALIVAWRLLTIRNFQVVSRDWLGPTLGFGLAALLTVLLYLPILFDVQALFVETPERVNVAPAGWAISETLRHLQIGFASGGAAVLVILLMLVGAWSYFRQSAIVLALFVLPGPMTLAAAIMLQHPVRPRFVFFLAGFVLLIVVRGAMTVGRWVARALPSSPFGQRLGELLPLGLVAGVAVASAVALPYGYRYPKQDFEQALRYVEAHRGSDDAVVVAGGGAALPYQRYYQRPWKRLESVGELRAIRNDHPAVWLLYTFPKYIEAGQPDLMSEIVVNCARVKTFQGTVTGGDIVVNKCGSS